jgi:phage tail sheath protein FI
MPVSPTYPGVYVQEVPSGVRTIVGVGTSTALFVGRSATGPMMTAVRLTTYTDFVRTFGDDGGTVSQMSRYVRLFFLNGGTDCYVIRIANGWSQSSVDLLPASGSTPVLTIKAVSPGSLGDLIRVAVDYNTASPESTFNLTAFRWKVTPGGSKSQEATEKFLNLSMDPASPAFVVSTLAQKSKLVSAVPGSYTPAPGYSFSTAPLVHSATGSTFAADFTTNVLPKANQFKLWIGNSAPLNIVIPALTGIPALPATSDVRTALGVAITKGIQNVLPPATPLPVVDVLPGPAAAAGSETTVVRISAPAASPVDIRIASAASSDFASLLGLGVANNGIEVGAYADARPAPNGVTLLDATGLAPGGAFATSNWMSFAGTAQNALTQITLDAVDSSGNVTSAPINFTIGTTAKLIWLDSKGGGAGVLEALGDIRDAINAYAAANGTAFFWQATLWGNRLAITSSSGDDNAIVGGTGLAFAGSAGSAMTARFLANTRMYSLGPNGTAGRQANGKAGSDGGAPGTGDYDAAYVVAQRDIDLFNLLVLPPDADPAAPPLKQLWPNASAVCAAKRAFLIMDPEPTWTDTQSAASGVNALRPGLTKDYSAVYFPRLKLVENGREYVVGPAGAVAGVYARIDSTRGVWKAPAGSDADIRGVSGIDLNMSDLQNGQINPVGVNAVRLFPEGVISWGARTMDGADAFASEYKYVPIRRLALYIEESLYRGLKWVVFEPNDEPLWAQVRLNVGSFMHDLFRKGAFQGATPADAYFVKCDKETTTPSDQDLGLVNIWVGFAPLKPAEFVVLYLQQIAQQLST